MSDTTRDFEMEDADRMSEQEALMWNVEKDPWLNPSGGAISIYDKPINVEQFRRKLRQAITQVPRMPAHVNGVINLRGKVVPVIELRTRFTSAF